MDIIIRPTAEDAAVVAADIIEDGLRRSDDRVFTLGLATGSSPEATYTELIRRHREDGLSFAAARAFLLDEYIGLGPEDEQSYHATIRRAFTRHIDISEALVHSPRGNASDPHAEAERYDAAIRTAGGVDVQLLGIGRNGHIAFNEPASSLASRTRPVVLTRDTVEANARFFSSAADVPRRAISQGLGTIMEARRIVLVAHGEGKAEAVAQLIEGAVSARWPATILQHHPDITIAIDEGAASRLELGEYYRALEEDSRDLSG